MNGVGWRRPVGFALAVGVGLLTAQLIGALLVPASRAAVAPGAPAGPRPPAPMVDAGPEAAFSMIDRYHLFRTGNAGARMELDGAELTALLRHALPGLLPQGVHDPTVHVEGRTLVVLARVTLAELPGDGTLEPAFAIMPDEVAVRLSGRIAHLPGAVAFRIDRAEVEGFPLPNGVVGRLVRAWPAGAAPGSPAAPQPAPVAPWSVDGTRFAVEDGALVLHRHGPLVAKAAEAAEGSGGA